MVDRPLHFPTRALVLAVACLSACGESQGPPLTVSPTQASLFGQVEVTFRGDFAVLGEVRSLTVGGLQVYGARWSDTSATVTLQGAAQPGPADVVVVGSKGRAVYRGLIRYQPSPSGVPLRWAAFGASLTQGTQSGGIDPHTQILGVSGQIARAAGVFLALPLFNPDLLPPLRPSDLNRDCSQKANTGAGLESISRALANPDTHMLELKRGRIDPTLQPRNLAVGSSKTADVLNGGRGAVAFLEYLVEDPYVDFSRAFSIADMSQIARLERLDPDVAFSTDLLANDVDGSVLQKDGLHPEAITDLGIVRPMLAEIMSRLGRLHGQYFIANVPYVTLLPNVRVLAQQQMGDDFAAKLATIEKRVDAYNAALAEVMAPYPNLHLVDFKSEVDRVNATGVVVGGERLTTDRLGGLLSIDDLHFTDTGYAIYANCFIQAINAVLHTSIPLVDVEAVHADDALAPSRLRGSLDCVPPPG